MIEETLKKLKGTFTFEIKDVNGKVRDTWSFDNLVTNAGFAQLALLAGDASATPFTYIAVGTSSTAPAVTLCLRLRDLQFRLCAPEFPLISILQHLCRDLRK